MGFAENLQFMRQKKGYTQEQIAEQLQVSRQSVSKWESGGSFPEMDKLLQLSGLFQCSMDVLVQGDARASYVEEHEEYDKHMNEYSRAVTSGVGLLLFGTAVYELLSGVYVAEKFCDMLFMVFVVAAVLIFVVQGMKHSAFTRKYPVVGNIYTDKETDTFQKRYITMCAAGIGLLFCGFIFELGMDGVALPPRSNEEAVHGVFMLIVTAAASLLVYAGMQKKKYSVYEYNDDNMPGEAKRLIGRICGSIMMAAAIVFLLGGFLANAWNVSWVAFPVGGILCGIVSTLLVRERK